MRGAVADPCTVLPSAAVTPLAARLNTAAYLYATLIMAAGDTAERCAYLNAITARWPTPARLSHGVCTEAAGYLTATVVDGSLSCTRLVPRSLDPSRSLPTGGRLAQWPRRRFYTHASTYTSSCHDSPQDILCFQRRSGRGLQGLAFGSAVINRDDRTAVAAVLYRLSSQCTQRLAVKVYSEMPAEACVPQAIKIAIARWSFIIHKYRVRGTYRLAGHWSLQRGVSKGMTSYRHVIYNV